MERYRFLALCLPFLAAAAAAQESFSLETESAWIMDSISLYYLPVVGVLLLVFLLSLLVNRATGRRYSIVEFLATVTGVLLGLVLIVTGLALFAAAAALAWGTATDNPAYAEGEVWAIPISNGVQSVIQPFLDSAFGGVDYNRYLQNILLGVFLLGGAVLILIGAFIIWKIPKSSFYEIITPGKTTTFKEVMTRGQEPLAPTVTFKVIDRLTNQPSADVKVILKHKEGAKVYNRYTDFNGEVIFQKIDGLYSQYYAFVEGDEERKRYWVIRTAIGAESVT
jgi:hypothetical protein